MQRDDGVGALVEACRPSVVLLVDDDPQLLTLFATLLSRDFVVITANSGASALKIAGEEEQLDILLTDVRMPEMNGADLGKRIAELRPEVARVYMSGFVGDAALEAGATLVKKPFDAQAMITTLHAVLGAHRAP